MGKRITQQARGKGSLTFKVRRKAYKYKLGYPRLDIEGKGKIVKLINSSAHSTPLAKISLGNNIFFIPAANNIFEGQEIEINGNPEIGNIVRLKNIPQGTKVFNIESFPGSGGKFLRSGGSSGTVMDKENGNVNIVIKRRRIKLNEECRAIIGVASADGRLMKPVIKAGRKHHLMKSKGRKWHRTSAVKVNAIDHPFGGGRGKRIKSKISKRNSPPGMKVGHLRPRRTGKK
jgi:large subunit ribosomal protein L2